MFVSMKILKISLITATLIYLGVISLLYIAQKHLVFSSKQISPEYRFNFKSQFTEGFFTSSHNKKINYLTFKQPAPKQIIIYYRGNAQALDQWGLVAEKLSSRTNSDVWIFDYPGFGKSREALPASNSELLKLGEDFYQYILKAYSKKQKIVVFGRSLGSGIASHVAKAHKLNNVVLDTAYYSTKKVALERFPFIPGFLFRYNLDNSVLKDSEAINIIVFHGTNDKVIPYHHTKELSKALPKAKLITFEGGGHGNLETYNKYWATMDNYFNNL